MVLPAVLDLVRRLRIAGVPVSMVEAIDAMHALRQVDLADRSQFRSALAATLVKRADHEAAFEALFDICFGLRRPMVEASQDAASGDPASITTSLDRTVPGEGNEDSAALLNRLLDALRRDDQAELRTLAAMAVELHAGINLDRTATRRYYLYRVLRQLDIANLLARGARAAEEDPDSPFEGRLARDEEDRRIDEFRKLLAEAIRHRLSQVKGVHDAATGYDYGLLEDVDFLGASPSQLNAMREAIRPLARKLASRGARQRRLRRRGQLDVRRTMRRSLGSGGVPLEPAFRFPRSSRPELFLLCDVSGSVAEFATFTLSLLYAMNQEFSRIRSFAFVDGVDEVTSEFDHAGILRPAHLIARKNLIWADGHSDYGNVLSRFLNLWGWAALGPKATVVITGDARNNYRAPGEEALRAIKSRARRVFWLNPEPRARWNTTDSIMDTYAPYCDAVVEARNLRQLTDFVIGMLQK
jgi:uncharacterized protein with von Willebrand factor type A (vWA) domain